MQSDEAPPKPRAVMYARISSLAQKDRYTIDSQVSTLPGFVALRGWNLVRRADTYVDDGRTAKAGFLAQRTAFTRLMADANRGEFDVIAVVDLDRDGRHRAHVASSISCRLRWG